MDKWFIYNPKAVNSNQFQFYRQINITEGKDGEDTYNSVVQSWANIVTTVS